MPRPPLEPELAAFLQSMPAASRTVTLTPDRIAELRANVELHQPDPEELSRHGAVKVSDLTIPGPFGAPDLQLVVLRPIGHTRPIPAILSLHGGGMVAGHRWLKTPDLAEWAEELGVVGLSVEYRLAPEHPHPAPVEDCYAALCWVVEHADDLGIDPNNIIVWGQSAGGGLAAAVMLLARDRGGPSVTHQILQAPMLDDRHETPSSSELDGEGIWDQHSNSTGWSALLGDAVGGPAVPSYAAPARETDLSNLPPAFIDVGQVETFRDEAIIYAMRLSAAGVPVELHVWPGAWHGFDTGAPEAGLSQLANATRRAYVERAVN